MNEAYNTALMLLLVGMITVFIILASVVFAGKLIILVVNKYFPEKLKHEINAKMQGSISGSKLSALIAAVDIITQGKGKINDVKRENN